jgi:hypothetical protein
MNEIKTKSPKHVLPRWVLVLYIIVAIILIPWIFILSYALPTHHIFRNWDLAWVGLDCALFMALLATLYFGYRRSRWLAIPSTVLATLLILDVWFDVLSAHPGKQLLTAIFMAIAIELPLALISMWLAVRSIKSLTRAETTGHDKR